MSTLTTTKASIEAAFSMAEEQSKNARLSEILAKIIRNGRSVEASTKVKEYLPVLGKAFYYVNKGRGEFRFITTVKTATGQRPIDASDLAHPIELPGRSCLSLYQIAPSIERHLSMITIDLSTSSVDDTFFTTVCGEKGLTFSTTEAGKKYVFAYGRIVGYGEAGTRGYIPSVTGMNQIERGNITKIVLDSYNKKNNTNYVLEVAQPSWIHNGHDANVLNIVVSSINFTEILMDRLGIIGRTDRLKARIRLGKDVLGTFIAGRTTNKWMDHGRILVLPEVHVDEDPDQIDRDGVIFVNTSNVVEYGKSMLARGKGRMESDQTNICLVKGRVMYSPAMANNAPVEMPAGLIGWCYAGAIKFASITKPTIIEIVIGYVKDENYKEKSSYSVQTLALEVGDFDKESEAKLAEAYDRNYRKIASNYSNLNIYLASQIVKVLETDQETDSMSVNGQVARYLLQQTEMNAGVQDSLVSILKRGTKVRDRKILRARVIYSTEVISDGKRIKVRKNRYYMSASLKAKRDAIAENIDSVDTLLGYPMLDKFGMIASSPADYTIDDVTEDCIICHPVLGKMGQRDCDDDVNILVGIKSQVTYKDHTQGVIEKHVQEMDMQYTNVYTVYHHGVYSQESTGGYTNAYMHSIAYAKQVGGIALANTVRDALKQIGQAIQACVQGVKKPVKPALTLQAATKLAKEVLKKHNICPNDVTSAVDLMTAKNLDNTQAAYASYGYNLTDPEDQVLNGLECDVDATIISAVDNVDIIGPTKVSDVVLDHLCTKWGVNKLQPTADMVGGFNMVAIEYYGYCTLLANKADGQPAKSALARALKNSNGVLSYMGYLNIAGQQ